MQFLNYFYLYKSFLMLSPSLTIYISKPYKNPLRIVEKKMQ